jgi:sigma-B regulation protein RsbU (phosphoserine phosphatase)
VISEYAEIFGRMIESLDNPVMILDEKQNIVYINRSMEETFGNLLGHTAEFLLESDTTDQSDETGSALEAIRKNRAGHTEATLSDVIYDLLLSPVCDTKGNQHLVVLFDDITENRHLEIQMKQNVNKLKNETGIAKHIQNSILPIDDEYWNSIRINSLYLPTDDLGGDVFDIIQLSESETLLYIADVSGHGIQASLLTVFLREKVRAKKAVARKGLDLLLSEILRGFIALDIDARLYLSILVCKYDKAEKELSIANAGHNCFPLVIRQSGRVEEIPVRGMPISRISSMAGYEEEIIGMHPGDRLILYTDGIIEEYSKAEKKVFGPEGVRRVAEQCYNYEGKLLAQKIIAEAAAYTMVAPKDDRTIIVADML